MDPTDTEWSQNDRDTTKEVGRTPSEGECSGFDSGLVELVTETPSDQESGEVWADLDACANLADVEGAFEDGDLVTRFCETVGSREAAKTATDDDDMDW